MMVLGWSVFLSDPGRSAPSLAGLVGLQYTISAILGGVFILVILYFLFVTALGLRCSMCSLLFWCAGFSVLVAHGLSCPVACGILVP